MKKSIAFALLPMIISGCVYTHTWHHQSVDITGLYRLVDSGGETCLETELDLEYERHLFTDKAGFTYCRMNPIEALIQIPCIILTELPFRWMWEKEYVYRVPIKCDKSLNVTHERLTGMRQLLSWEDGRSIGVSNTVCATVKVLDESTGDSEISVAHCRNGIKVSEVDLEPVFWESSYHIFTLDGRYVYVFSDFDKASYLYGYFRCGPAAKTSWCPILLELDLETGIVRRLVWTEYNTLYYSDDVIMERRK